MANITVRMSPVVEKYLASARIKSAAANQAIECWIASEKRARRAIVGLFTANELKALIDVLNGTVVDYAYADSIQHEFEDGCQLDGLDKKWGLDKDAVLAKMDPLSLPEWIVLYQVAREFWENPEQDMEEYVMSWSSK